MGIANACTLSQMDCVQRRAHALQITRFNVIAITRWAKWPNGARNWHPRAIYAKKNPRYSCLEHHYLYGPDGGSDLGCHSPPLPASSRIPGLAAGLVNASLKKKYDLLRNLPGRQQCNSMIVTGTLVLSTYS